MVTLCSVSRLFRVTFPEVNTDAGTSRTQNAEGGRDAPLRLLSQRHAGARGEMRFYGLLSRMSARQMALGSQRDATAPGGADQNPGRERGSRGCLRADVAPPEPIRVTSKRISQRASPRVYNSLWFSWMPESTATLAPVLPTALIRALLCRNCCAAPWYLVPSTRSINAPPGTSQTSLLAPPVV